MKQLAITIMILALTLVLGCTGMSKKQQSTLSGAGIGAVGGGVLGAATGGSAVSGAVIGAGVGGAAGYLLEE
ncbi:MAG TPA: YMGG-like glycine zipper-containing protein [Geothermobacteraceae bacterium]|nr:YMGG-like glycine zipper-containing protein [Geothermobacteraceae bacterium]